jgi:hypothetical protein
MATNIIKEKERQENLVYVFIFLVVFIVLFWIFPPSFNLSFSNDQEKFEKESHLEIISILEGISLNKFGDFETPPVFQEISGRDNPFSLEGTSSRAIIEEEVQEEIEEETQEEENDDLPNEN